MNQDALGSGLGFISRFWNFSTSTKIFNSVAKIIWTKPEKIACRAIQQLPKQRLKIQHFYLHSTGHNQMQRKLTIQ